MRPSVQWEAPFSRRREIHGWWAFGEAWERARPLVVAQFEERGRSFTAMAREGAARRIGVTVLEGAVEDIA